MNDNLSLKMAVDVHYRTEGARAAGVIFSDWDAPEVDRVVTAEVSEFADYQPGEFYRRELPPILALLEKVDPSPAYVVVDGYVYLG